MAIRHIKDGENFQFDRDFGFHGSAEAPVRDNDRDGHGPSSPPYADASKTRADYRESPSNMSREGGPTENYAEGGHVEHHPEGHRTHHHPDGTHSVHHMDGRVMHHHMDGSHTVTHPDGRIVEHHAMGGHTVHHSDGREEHHDHEGRMTIRHPDGSMDHHDSSEYVHRAKGGAMHEGTENYARGGMAGERARLPRGMKPTAERPHSPINTPPRNPNLTTSPRNAMPGGQMPYGVEPSAEPDDAGSDQSGMGAGMPGMKKGGHARMR